ncbi:MAG: prepilin peptidase [Jatrophihabitans sp.]|nr:MAG: prepilin peptidase [Jatrophihabitans sp.]
MSADHLLIGLIGLLGLLIGSFLNVVIYRVPRAESIVHPGSHCPTCANPLKGRHNVPVLSWIALRGRCAYCAARISARYPLVEIGTATLFVAVTVRFGLSAALPAYLYLAAIGITLAMIDFDVHRLPDTLVLPSYVVAVLLLMPAGAVTGDGQTALRALAGMVAVAAIYFALVVAYPYALGAGDVKLAGLLGLYLGWMSWSAVIIGAVGGLAILAVGGAFRSLAGARRHGLLALAPAMVCATILTLFVAVPITSWYTAVLTGAA